MMIGPLLPSFQLVGVFLNNHMIILTLSITLDYFFQTTLDQKHYIAKTSCCLFPDPTSERQMWLFRFLQRGSCVKNFIDN